MNLLDILVPILFLSPAPIPEINRLINLMDNDSYFVREKATKDMAKLGLKATPQLEAIIEQNRVCYEAKRRCEVALNRIYYKIIKPRNYDKLPWITGLPDDYPNRQDLIARYLSIGGDPADGWSGYRCATWFLARDWLRIYARYGIDETELLDLLDQMAESEKKWWKDNKQPKPIH